MRWEPTSRSSSPPFQGYGPLATGLGSSRGGSEVPGPCPQPGGAGGDLVVEAAADVLRRLAFCVRAEAGRRKCGYQQIPRQV